MFQSIQCERFNGRLLQMDSSSLDLNAPTQSLKNSLSVSLYIDGSRMFFNGNQLIQRLYPDGSHLFFENGLLIQMMYPNGSCIFFVDEYLVRGQNSDGTVNIYKDEKLVQIQYPDGKRMIMNSGYINLETDGGHVKRPRLELY
jgi:hypothetical protein